MDKAVAVVLVLLVAIPASVLSSYYYLDVYHKPTQIPNLMTVGLGQGLVMPYPEANSTSGMSELSGANVSMVIFSGNISSASSPQVRNSIESLDNKGEPVVFQIRDNSTSPSFNTLIQDGFQGVYLNGSVGSYGTPFINSMLNGTVSHFGIFAANYSLKPYIESPSEVSLYMINFAGYAEWLHFMEANTFMPIMPGEIWANILSVQADYTHGMLSALSAFGTTRFSFNYGNSSQLISQINMAETKSGLGGNLSPRWSVPGSEFLTNLVVHNGTLYGGVANSSEVYVHGLPYSVKVIGINISYGFVSYISANYSVVPVLNGTPAWIHLAYEGDNKYQSRNSIILSYAYSTGKNGNLSMTEVMFNLTFPGNSGDYSWGEYDPLGAISPGSSPGFLLIGDFPITYSMRINRGNTSFNMLAFNTAGGDAAWSLNLKSPFRDSGFSYSIYPESSSFIHLDVKFTNLSTSGNAQSNTTDMLVYVPTGQQIHNISSSVFSLSGNYIYYISNGTVSRLNMSSGNRSVLFPIHINAPSRVSVNYGNVFILNGSYIYKFSMNNYTLQWYHRLPQYSPPGFGHESAPIFQGTESILLFTAIDGASTSYREYSQEFMILNYSTGDLSSLQYNNGTIDEGGNPPGISSYPAMYAPFYWSSRILLYGSTQGTPFVIDGAKPA